jgi:hypothetical protein
MTGRTASLAFLACVMVAAAVGGALMPRRTGAQFLSPGKLTRAHAEIEGDANCSECHSSGKGLDTNACLACHDDLGVRIRRGLGLHATREYREQSCGRCHVEHLGRDAKLVRWPGGRKERFDHRKSGWPLEGAHASVACGDCHDSRNRRGAPSFLGLKTDCVSCHEDPHEGKFAGAECTSCHNQSDWTQVTNVRPNHPGLSLAAGHAKTKCEACHDEGNVAPPSMGSDCVACHAQVHEANFGNRCESCHASIRWTGLPKKIGLRAHPLTVFPLEGLHQSVACNKCHSPKLPADRRYRRLQFEQCGDCHRDVHRGTLGNADCASCHDEHGFWPTQFTVEQHGQTKFPLLGRHQAAPCTSCHRAKRPRHNLELRSKRCIDCHDNPHGDQFAGEMRDGGCAHCHSERGWDSPKIDHSTWPLTGAHSEASCDSCHSPSKKDRLSGRGATYQGAPRDCAGCHRDIHAGQFRLSAPERECEACHATESFAIEAFAHEQLADYPLEGAHAELKCVGCHQRERLRSGVQVVRYRLGYRECADCHGNPHARRKGQR